MKKKNSFSKTTKDKNNNNNEQNDIENNKKKLDNHRIYKCKDCDKSYLSYPALFTHRKQKHNINSINGGKRGRPKKINVINKIEKIKYNPLNVSFFLKDERTGNVQNENDFKFSINFAFNSLYNDDKKDIIIKLKKMKFYTDLNSHPFLKMFLNDNHDVNIKIEDDELAIDYVFIDYLNKMSLYCNKEYYGKLILFVLLFREFINLKKSDKNENYSNNHNAEDVPDLSNEFINDFLEPENKYFDFDKEESINLTQNICNWMYENNFTTSELSRIIKSEN